MSDRRLYGVAVARTIRRATANVVPNSAGLERQRSLTALVPMWPHELVDESVEGRLRVCKLLRAAIRAERRRGIGANTTYSVLRHAGLLRVYRNELRELRTMIDRKRFAIVHAVSGIRSLR